MPTPTYDYTRDYPVRNAAGEILIAKPFPDYTPTRPAPRDPGPDYPVFDGNGQVIIAVPYEGYGSEVEPFVPRMLDTYVVPDMPALPTQLLPNPAMDDPAAWVVANGWTLNGDGTATHNTATGQYSRIAIPNADMGDATDIVLTFDIPAQTSSNFTLGVRARSLSTPGNTSNNQLWNGLYTRSGDAGPSARSQVELTSAVVCLKRVYSPFQS